jgi:hypothetical protein
MLICSPSYFAGDIRIEPPRAMDVKTGPNHNKAAHRNSRKAF